jgi:branched-chain amino acid aminotransferase
MQATHFWVNDGLINVADAKISVLDHGFTVADGVFETLLVLDGQVFARDLHLTRLAKSASGLGIALPEVSKLNLAIDQVLDAHQAMDFGRLRLTVTSGSGPLGSERSNAKPTLVVTISAQDKWPESTSALLVPWTRNEDSPLAGLKTTSYAENAFALEAAKSRGFSEALYCDTSKRLSEGTGSNVFLVSNGVVVTPSDASGLLRGVTRDLVIKWAGESGIEIEQRDVSSAELWEAQELFLTSSTRDVLPITNLASLDASLEVGNQRTLAVGTVTLKLAEIFQQQRTRNMNP